MTPTTPAGNPASEPALAVDIALHGTAVLGERVLPGALVLVAQERIVYAGPAHRAPAHRAAEQVEHGGLILPGLVDVHNHGGGGVSFPDCEDPQQALVAVQEHRRHGTTTMLASLVTADPATLRARVGMLAQLFRDGEIAGVHLEGPFISPARKGAQNPAHITGGDAELVAELCALGGGAVASMTVAPEAEDAHAVLDALAAGGAVPSLGHTDAGSEIMTAGIAAARRALAAPHGRSALPSATHLFNGMRPIHHRDPGPALAALDAAARGELLVEVIADGVHLAAETVAHVFAIAAPGSVLLITDAMAAAGMPDGQYSLGALDVTVDGGVATLTEGGSIAGGTAHLLDVVRFAVQEAGVDLGTAVAAASRTPARLLGAEGEIGELTAGARADVVLVDEDLQVLRVLRAGRDVV
ncbi:N-acetylglucosamine-6-phosphate deacetylase [Brachybacterium hainanense]|uniref:N-acetylglucosamine-6-phosphate deacetylase n=1 Tax=Brachybacterium hainanense TaxID=1541174 RepID=A0ABV6R8T6_9MICO